MKKLLSLILAIAMILTLIPAAFAADTETGTEPLTIRYNLGEIVANNTSARQTPTAPNFAALFSYAASHGFFKYKASTTATGRLSSSPVQYPGSSSTGLAAQVLLFRTTTTYPDSGYIAFEVNVPVSGTYTMKAIERYHNPRIVHVYHVTETTTDYTNSKYEIGTYNNKEHYDDKPVVNTLCDVLDSDNNAVKINLTAGTHIFAFKGDYSENYSTSYYGSLGDFYLISGDGNGAALMPYYNGNTTLEVGETATLKGYKSSDASETAVSYSVTGDAVTVDEETGTITAKKAGTATVTMTATDASITAGEKSYSVDITVEDAETDFVSIGVDYGDDSGVIEITEKALGDEVTVTAKDRENMVFRGWVRGSAENGRLVSTDETYKFTAMTNTYLTAIYTEKVEGEANEYYHWNGQFLGNDRPATVSPIVGYTFAETWTEAKKENSITSWIADFKKKDDDYTVTAGNDGFSISKADSKYDTEVTCTSDNGAVYWYRDNKLVDYGTEYKFFIWDNTTITTKATGHNGAKLMLDENVKDNTYMVEYDAGDKTLLEVGILFGDTGSTPTVDVCKEKMSSQRSLNAPGHGQFSATSEYAVARGYLVYQDGTSYRVIYTDAIALANAD